MAAHGNGNLIVVVWGTSADPEGCLVSIESTSSKRTGHGPAYGYNKNRSNLVRVA